MTSDCQQTSCPILKLLSFISKKWSLLIMRSISDGAKYYSEIEEKIPGINPAILCQRLKDLQEFGFIEKKIISETPLKAEYSFTKKGREFSNMIDQMADWALKNIG